MCCPPSCALVSLAQPGLVNGIRSAGVVRAQLEYCPQIRYGALMGIHVSLSDTWKPAYFRKQEAGCKRCHTTTTALLLLARLGRSTLCQYMS